MNKYIKVLKNKDFCLLWLGQGVSNFGSRINYIGLTWLITELTGQVSKVSILFIILTIPSVFIGPWAGVLVDRWNKKRIIVTADLIRGLLAFGMVLTENLIYLYILALTQAVFTTFFSPAIMSAVPRLVKKEDLVIANSLSSSTRYAANLVGPALAGVLIGFYGVKIAFLINGISFILSAFSEIWITIPVGKMETSQKITGVFDDFKEGLKYIQSNEVVKFVIIFFAFVMLIGGALPILYVVLIKEVFKFTSQQYGLLMTIQGIGLLIGTLIMGKLGHKYSELKLQIGGGSILGLTYIGLALSNYFVWVAVSFVILGIFSSIINVAYGTFLQKVVDDDIRGRVFSIDIAFGNITALLSMSLAGFLADSLGTVTVMLFGGIYLFSLGILFSRFKTYKSSVKKSHV
jgi:MFS family permease